MTSREVAILCIPFVALVFGCADLALRIARYRMEVIRLRADAAIRAEEDRIRWIIEVGQRTTR